MIRVRYCYEHGKYIRGDSECGVCEEEKTGHASEVYSIGSLMADIAELGLAGGASGLRKLKRYRNLDYNGESWHGWQEPLPDRRLREKQNWGTRIN